MITAIDTNVLLDILKPGSDQLAEAAERALEVSLASGALVISETVYSELAHNFESQSVLDNFLGDTRISLQPSPREALVKAAAAFRNYLARRGQGFICPSCGTVNNVLCTSCGRPIQARQHPLSDFFIGGHALVCADALLTRDRGIYRTYFPRLMLKSP